MFVQLSLETVCPVWGSLENYVHRNEAGVDG